MSDTRTTRLIEELATGLRPTLGRTPRLLLAIAGGAATSLAVLWLWHGFRADLGLAMYSGALWMKWIFALATAVAAFGMCARVARPESGPGWWLVAVMLPLAFAAGMAGIEWWNARAPGPVAVERVHSALECLWFIFALSIPLLLAVLWAFRRFAPTRLRLAGFSGGLLAGSVAAAVYSLHCVETSAVFIAIWYGLGMFLPSVLGLVLGPRMLRW
jgi:hypothetical protein